MLIHSTSLNWLTRHFKSYSCPLVVIQENAPSHYDTYFDWDINTICQIDDSEIFNAHGIIVLSSNTTLPEETLILHEFRHSLQFELNGKWYVPNYNNGESLDDYNQNIFERDARLFEVSLGFHDSFTDYFSTPKIIRVEMLQLPTAKFLRSLT